MKDFYVVFRPSDNTVLVVMEKDFHYSNIDEPYFEKIDSFETLEEANTFKVEYSEANGLATI